MTKRAKRPIPPPVNVFNNGLNLWAGADHLTRGAIQQNQGAFTWPAMVLYALGCEVLLKCLQILEGRTRIEGHALDHLFNVLSPKRKARIEELWDSYAKPLNAAMAAGIRATGGDADFIQLELGPALFRGRLAFEKLRYPYPGVDRGGAAPMHLIPVLIAVILEEEPEWTKYATALGYKPIV